MSLKDAIPTEWRKLLKTMKITPAAISFTEQIHLMINKNLKNINNITNKDIYWIFIKSKQVQAIITNKLEQTYNIHKEQWKQIFTMSAVVKGTKFRAFQYKILFNLIPCNLYLNRIKRSMTDKCVKCNGLEDIMHYIIECPETKALWQQLEHWWKNINNQTVTLCNRDIILGLKPRKHQNEGSIKSNHNDSKIENTC
jgi:hypothetical protein